MWDNYRASLMKIYTNKLSILFCLTAVSALLLTYSRLLVQDGLHEKSICSVDKNTNKHLYLSVFNVCVCVC